MQYSGSRECSSGDGEGLESQPQEQGREQGCQGGHRDDQGASKETHAGDLQPHEQGHDYLADHVPEKGTRAVQDKVKVTRQGRDLQPHGQGEQYAGHVPEEGTRAALPPGLHNLQRGKVSPYVPQNQERVRQEMKKVNNKVLKENFIPETNKVDKKIKKLKKTN